MNLAVLWRCRCPGSIFNGLEQAVGPRPVGTLAEMANTTADARAQMLEVVADATDRIAFGLASLGEAYELLDEASADRLERDLFGPVQAAYGRAKRTHAEFAKRHSLSEHTFAQSPPGSSRDGARGLIGQAVEAIAEADGVLSSLQDSMMPVELGDPQFRAGLQEVRQTIGNLRASARELLRVLGR
ncbi:MAG: hypothetical protein ACR2ND_09045 [Solirubrobacteraceae bacterium]